MEKTAEKSAANAPTKGAGLKSDPGSTHRLLCQEPTSPGPGLSPRPAVRSEEEVAKDAAGCCAESLIFLFLSDVISVYL